MFELGMLLVGSSFSQVVLLAKSYSLARSYRQGWTYGRLVLGSGLHSGLMESLVLCLRSGVTVGTMTMVGIMSSFNVHISVRLLKFWE